MKFLDNYHTVFYHYRWNKNGNTCICSFLLVNHLRKAILNTACTRQSHLNLIYQIFISIIHTCTHSFCNRVVQMHSWNFSMNFSSWMNEHSVMIWLNQTRGTNTVLVKIKKFKNTVAKISCSHFRQLWGGFAFLTSSLYHLQRRDGDMHTEAKHMCCFPKSAGRLNNGSRKCRQPHFPWMQNSQPPEVLILTISTMSMLLRTVCCGTSPQFQVLHHLQHPSNLAAEFSSPYSFCKLRSKTDVQHWKHHHNQMLIL